MFKRKPDPDERARYFWAELYPDSAPANWLEDFRMMGKAFSVSPLHDKDKFEDGTPKKPHYHVIIDWGNTTTYRTVAKVWESYNQPFPLILPDVYAAYGYHYHRDNPEKYPYDENEIRNFNRFDPLAFLDMTKSQIETYMDNVEQYIFENNVTEFFDLIRAFYNEKEIKRVIRTHVWYFKCLCDGMRYSQANIAQ